MERERSALQCITSTAMEGAIPPCVLEGSSTSKEWEEIVGWVLGELGRLPTGEACWLATGSAQRHATIAAEV
jgi:hypothetical protein